MAFQRGRTFSSWNPPSQETNAQFAPRPFAVQAQADSRRPPSQQEIGNEAFNQNKFEAFGLQLKKERGTITSVEQENLGVLQAKMNDFWTQRLEQAKAQPNMLEILTRNSQATQTTESQTASQSTPIQAKSDTTGDRPDAFVEQRPNRTGVPDALKAGVERLSGYSLDDVRVHYNSPKPAQLHALAYAQGTEIHVASGQEEHLPHEAWHVVQQAQGRVKPTMQLKDGVPVNDDAGLEREADVMGAQALASLSTTQRDPSATPRSASGGQSTLAPVQAYKETRADDGGTFVGESAACHCHINVGKPHFKVGKDDGSRMNFGRDMSKERMQRAYEALLAQHKGKKGYEDCKEYLEQQGCKAPEPGALVELLKGMLAKWGGISEDKISFYTGEGVKEDRPVYSADQLNETIEAAAEEIRNSDRIYSDWLEEQTELEESDPQKNYHAGNKARKAHATTAR